MKTTTPKTQPPSSLPATAFEAQPGRYALVASDRRAGFAYVLDTQPGNTKAARLSVVDAVLFFGAQEEAARLAYEWNQLDRLIANDPRMQANVAAVLAQALDEAIPTDGRA